MQLPDGLVGGLAVILLGWVAAGTGWLVRIGIRMKTVEACLDRGAKTMELLAKHAEEEKAERRRAEEKSTQEVAKLTLSQATTMVKMNTTMEFTEKAMNEIKAAIRADRKDMG